MKEITLTQGKVALVDDEDFDLLNQFKWYAQKGVYTFYAVRQERAKNRRKILMHRQVLNIVDSKIIPDHKDHNGLNNQRCNLRSGTQSQNNGNRRGKISGTSKYKGVCRDKSHKKWQTHIQKNKQSIYIGLFSTEQEAALEYNKKAIELFGEFAYLNII